MSARLSSTPKARYPRSSSCRQKRPMPRKSTTGLVPSHYLPNQSLFDRDSVLDFITDDDHDLQEEEYDPKETSDHLSFYSTPASRSRSPLGESFHNCDISQHHSLDHDPLAQTGGTTIDIVVLLQEQQALLKKVVTQQESMQKQQQHILQKQKEFEIKFSNLDEKLSTSLSSTSGAGSASGGKQKARVTRQLTNLVASAHDTLEEVFHPNENSLSVHNQSVKKQLVKNIVSDKYTEEQVKNAVQRKYESMRRQWLLEEKENSMELVEEQTKINKYRARRVRKFNNRSQVVKSAEMQYWLLLSHAYVTEESDDESVIVEHKLNWRSQRLNEFMKELDKRYDTKIRKEGGAIMAKKKRKLGLPSNCTQPPSNAPKWAVHATKDISKDVEDTDHDGAMLESNDLD